MTPPLFLPQEVIRRKRDGEALPAVDIAAIVQGLVSGAVSEGQAAAFAMAVLWRGMSREECVALTLAMRDSGTVLDWHDGPMVDKHSTGGVGDKVSLVLAPIIAACGGGVPMISGRGLGHTGGTLDKLESIPGYNTSPSLDVFRQTVHRAGCAIIGQTDDLAPADRRLYAIRDVTATVESEPLITASILSKKLAAGLDALVVDIKTGNGAFAVTNDTARSLAESIVSVCKGAGVPCTAVITDMNQVLGRTAGNALEVHETLAFLRGDARDPRLAGVVEALSAALLGLSGLAACETDARTQVSQVLDTGAAAACFARMVAELGGPTDILERPNCSLPRAPVERAVLPHRAGYVQGIDTRALGLAVLALGGGRRSANDGIDHATGLSHVAAIGEAAGPDAPLCRIHARTAAAADAAAKRISATFAMADDPPPHLPPLLHGTVT